MIDFAVPNEVEALRERVECFVRDIAIPAESRDRGSHGLDDSLRAELQTKAKAAGGFGPQLSPELGGHGLDHRGCAVIFEQAGYGLLAPQALNCAAPDEGNMHLLD